MEEKSCGAVILRLNEGKYEALMVKHNIGHWGFPKGHVEEGESEIETAKREVKEETGYDVELDAGFREVSSYIPGNDPNIYKQVVYFVGRIESGELGSQTDEIEEVSWVPYTEALSLLSHRDDVYILRHVKKYMNQFENDE